MIRTWLNGLGRRTTSDRLAPNRRDRRRRRVLALEGLESRALMTAMTYTVNSLGDAGTGSGTSGDLRYAITQADLNAGSTIQFGVTGAIQLTSALPNLTANMTITGPGASSLSVLGGGASSNFTILTVDGGTTATISGLTFANANVIGRGGAIANQYGATLTVDGCTISNNSAANENMTANAGGGIANSGQILVENSTVLGNTAGVATDPNSNGSGAGLYNNNVMTVINCTFSGNSGNLGGGIMNDVGFTGFLQFSVGRLVVSNSTFSGNSAKYGGAICNLALLTVSDTTISGNAAFGGGYGLGGGIANMGDPASLPVFNNTIIAGNILEGSGMSADVYGVLSPASRNNLIGTGGSGGLTNGVNGNLVGVADPGLGVLGNNGGPTQTMGLLAGSPAIDAGDNTLAVDPVTGQPLTTDQRGTGFPRISGMGVDIGAFESPGPDVTATKIAVTDQPPARVVVGFGFGLTVLAEDASGNVATGYNGPLTVAFASNPGGATLGGTLTVNAVNGMATFTGLTLDKAGTGYTLQVSADGLAPATSGSFDATTETQTQLAVTSQPLKVSATVPFSLVVTAEDPSGNVAPTYNGPVTLTLIYRYSNQAVLDGTLTVNAVNGVATFSGLTLSEPSLFYVIQATADGLTPATTNSIWAQGAPVPHSQDFVIGTDDQVYTHALDSSGNPTGEYYQAAHGEVKDLAVSRLGTGFGSELFVIGPDNQVYASTVGGVTGSYAPTAYGSVASIAAGTDASGNPLIFAVGTDHQLYEQKFDAAGKPTSGSYTKAAYGDFRSTVMTHDANGNPLLYAVGQDGQVYGLKMDASGTPTGGLFKMGYGAVTQLVVGSDSVHDPELFVVGTDGGVYGLKAYGSGSPATGYFAVGGPVKSIAVGADGSGNPLLFAVGTDSLLYAHRFDVYSNPVGTFYGTATGAVTSIATGIQSDGSPEVFGVFAADSYVYLAPFDATGASTGPFALTTPGAVKKLVVL